MMCSLYDSSHSRLYCTDILHNKINMTALSHHGLVQIPGTFQRIRLQPFFTSNRKSSGIFRGLTGTQLFTCSLCALQSVSWNEATAWEITSNTEVSFSHEKFDFYISHILHLQNSSDELQIKSAKPSCL